jgi:hypothetical protein
MNRPSDETLMAYADDALDPVERARVERHLATDAEARRLVEMFRSTRALSQQAFATDLAASPPQALVDRILSHPLPDSAARAGNVVQFDRRRRSDAGTFRRHALPLAASVALALGVGTGWMLSRMALPSPAALQLALGPVDARSPVAAALERSASGTTMERVHIVATFRDRFDRVCREVEIVTAATAAQPEAAGVACRQVDGVWVVEGAARVATTEAPAGGGYAPSGASEKDALASLLTLLGAKSVLRPVEERELINRGWR